MHRDILKASQWIQGGTDADRPLPVFRKRFEAPAEGKLFLEITALGVYEAMLNGKRVGDFVMAPGWTHYPRRVQVQRYDLSGMLKARNELVVRLGRGWYGSKLMVTPHDGRVPLALRAILVLEDDKGERPVMGTDASWEWAEGETLSSSLYGGESVDCRRRLRGWKPVSIVKYPGVRLVPQDGPEVLEQDRLRPVKLLTTPKGERVLDFGQNLTGYVEIEVDGKSGQELLLHHAEILDPEGNFYTENLRKAEAVYHAILKSGKQVLKPRFTFYGFRYIRLTKWEGEASPDQFCAVVIHSQMERTGRFVSGNALVNQLYHNAVWGQKGNFVDVPTDCPQRDERMGWTGDAQAFIRAACYNYDALSFYRKWLRDLELCQYPGGGVPHFIPSQMTEQARLSKTTGCEENSAAWADAACICPWQLYLAYGEKAVLKEQFGSMKAWVDCIRRTGENEALWDSGFHFGDWLAQDAPNAAEGGCGGGTDKHLIATAMYANSTDLLVRAGKVLGKDMRPYEELHGRIVKAFQKRFMPGGKFELPTQTACVLALEFGLSKKPEETLNTLIELIRAAGNKLQTGFVGTPYLLHVLTRHGHARLAYDLLLQEEAPSWLHSVLHGATTMWERWDGIRADGSLNTPSMNSFNHYAFGAVADWLYGKAAGIEPIEEAPGYQQVRIAPIPDQRLGFVQAELKTRHGVIRSAWAFTPGGLRYEITVPEGVRAFIQLHHHEGWYGPGVWHF